VSGLDGSDFLGEVSLAVFWDFLSSLAAFTFAFLGFGSPPFATFLVALFFFFFDFLSSESELESLFFFFDFFLTVEESEDDELDESLEEESEDDELVEELEEDLGLFLSFPSCMSFISLAKARCNSSLFFSKVSWSSWSRSSKSRSFFLAGLEAPPPFLVHQVANDLE